MAGFSGLIQELDSLVMESLQDGVCQHLARNGQMLVADLPVIIEDDVERLNDVSGALDRVRTMEVQRPLIGQYDRRGAFTYDSITWHIDGIASDDGHMITFYVVP